MSVNQSDVTTLESSPAERLLAAAQPAVAAELNNILEGLRSQIESEADSRLQQALVEKDMEHKAEVERLRQTMAAEAESTLESRVEDLRNKLVAEHEARMTGEMESRLAALGEQKDAEAQAAAEALNEQQMVLERELERWRTLAEYLNKLGEASSQLEILRRFLLSGSRFASSVAVYLQKADGLSLWKSEGEGTPFPDTVSEDTANPDWFYSTIVVRGKAVAAVAATGTTDPEALTVMVAALKRAVETFGLRLRFMASESRASAEAAPVSEPASATEAPAAASAPAPESDDAPPEVSDPTRDEASAQAGDEAAETGQEAHSSAEEATSSTSADTSDRDDDLRQTARRIVAEIKFGHEKEVLEGRVNGDLYRRLQEPIEEGRKLYASEAEGAEGSDFFHEEVVRILADNIVSRLGADYPGPR